MIKNSMAEDLREVRRKNGDSPEGGDALGFGGAVAGTDKLAENENKIVLKTEDSLVNFKKPEISPVVPDSGEEISDAEKSQADVDGAVEDKSKDISKKEEGPDLITQKNLKNLQKREGGRSGSKKIIIVAIVLIVLGLLGYMAYVADIGGIASKSGDEEIVEEADEPDVVEDEKETEEENEDMPSDMLVRDEMRKDNLSIIFDAIDNSYDEAVGFSSSDVYSKLNEEGEIYEKIKEFVILAGFNEEEAVELMKDPQDPDFYFAYKSLNLNSFELTARLENQEDADCDDAILESEGICIFRGVLEKNVEIYQEDIIPEEETQDTEMTEEDNTWESEYPEEIAEPDPLIPEE